MLPTRLSVTGALLVPAALLLGLTACSAAPAAAPPEPAASAQGGGVHTGHEAAGGVGLYAVQSGPLGVVTTDAEGHLLYRSDADTADPPTSTCDDACMDTWFPLLMPEQGEPELLGVDPALIGRLQRADGGEQLTIAGWPVYRHVDDTGGLGDTGQHGVDGRYAVSPSGAKVVSP